MSRGLGDVYKRQLVNQAVLSLEHFTGTAIDAAEMKRRLADVLLP